MARRKHEDGVLSAAFVCTSREVSAKEISAILGLEPSDQHVKGEFQPQNHSYPHNRPPIPHPWHLWRLEFAGAQLDSLIEQVLECFATKQQALQQLAGMENLDISTTVWWDPKAGLGGYSFQADSLGRFFALGRDRFTWYLSGLGGMYEEKRASEPELIAALNARFGLDLDYLKWMWICENIRYDLGIDQRQAANLLASGHYVDAASGAVLACARDYLPDFDPTEDFEEGLARVCLMIKAPKLEPSQISQRLGLEPSRTFVQGERGSHDDPSVLRPWGLWAYDQYAREVDHAAADLLQVFTDKREVLQQIALDPAYEVSVGIWWEPPDGYGGFDLTAEHAVGLTALGCKLHVYLPGGMFYMPEDGVE